MDERQKEDANGVHNTLGIFKKQQKNPCRGPSRPNAQWTLL